MSLFWSKESLKASSEGTSAMLGYRMAPIDFIMAAVLGVATGVVLYFASSPILPSSMWTDVSASLGLTRADSVLNGLWRLVFGAVFSHLPLATATEVMRVLGSVAGGVSAISVFWMLRMFLPIMADIHLFDYMRLRWMVAIGLFAVSAAISFSDPFRRVFTSMTPDAFRMFLALTALLMVIRFVQTSNLLWLSVAYLFTGVLIGISVIGAVVFVLMMGILVMAKIHAVRPVTKSYGYGSYGYGGYGYGGYESEGQRAPRAVNEQMILNNPLVTEKVKWFFGFCLLVGLGAVVYLNFKGAGQVVSGGGTESLIKMATEYKNEALGLSSLSGLILVAVVCVVPLVIGLKNLKRAVDTELFLGTRLTCVYGAITLPPLLQLVGFDKLVVWQNSSKFGGDFMSVAVLLASGLLILISGMVFLVDIRCRNYKHILTKLYPDEDVPEESFATRGIMLFGKFAIPAFLVLGFVALVGLAVRPRPEAHTVENIVWDYVMEAARESAGSTWLYTDGGFDSGIALAARTQNGNLNIVSVWDADKTSVTNGKERVAWQSGLALWGLEDPDVKLSGVVAGRGLAEKDLPEGIKAAHALADRIARVYDVGIVARCRQELSRRLLELVQWRLARFAHLRSQAADMAGDAATAVNERKVADLLDSRNTSLKTVLSDVTSFSNKTLLDVAPEEGLSLALGRGDFMLARRFAVGVLNRDAENADANYAMGMAAFDEEKYAMAARFFETALAKHPNDYTLLCNISVSYLRLGNREKASQWAKKADAAKAVKREVGNAAP